MQPHSQRKGGTMSWIRRLLRLDSRRTVTHERVPCPMCGGRGVVEAPLLMSRLGLSTILRPCGRCRGERYVVVKKRQTPA